MSTLRNPVGPHDRKVYLRRRIVALLSLVAIVIVVVLIFVKPGSSSVTDTPASPKVPADLTATNAPKKNAADGKTPVCESSQLSVTALTDKADYAAGELPQLSFSIENTGSEGCSADVGTAGMVFHITSGDDEVWRSSDCQKAAESLPVILEPKKPLTSEVIEWDRTRSNTETCEIERDPVAADGASYHLTVEVAGVHSQDTAQFLLF